MRNHKLKALSMALLLLSGCSNTGSNGGSGTTSANEEATTLENPVRLDQLGVLPASNSSAASFLLQLTNYSKDKYTLISARAVDLTTGKDSTLVSVASQACNVVSANGSCSIQLTPHISQSADVKLEVTLKDQNGASRTLFQLIRISGALNANSGGIAMINDVDRIVTEDGNYSLSIPVVLGESFDDIKASNGSLLCNTTGYLKGSSCTYQVRGKVTGDGAVVSTRLEGIKANKTVAVEEASTRVEVAKGAHLLLSHGIKINHPESSAEITIFNSGNSLATEIATSVGNSSDLEIDDASNTCKYNLEANAACKVKVKVKSSVSINGQAPVSVNYKDGTTGLTTLTNIRYKVAAAAAGIEFSESSNTLSNAIVNGKVRSVIINIKNTGNRDLSNISYHLAPIGGEGLTLENGTTNSCDLSGAANLAVNTSCSLRVKYKPTAAQSKSTINLVINGKHNDEHGLAHSLINSHGLSYSATEVSAGNLVWTTTSGKDILSIRSNNNESESTIWKLSNTLAADEDLPASKVNVSLNPATINGLKVTPVDTVKCAPNADIAGNNACEYNVIYGPVSADQVETKVKLKADYTLDKKTLTSETSEFKVKADSIKAPKITVSVKIPENTTSSGDGTTQDPWSFTAYSDKLLKLTYTFKNEGNFAAESFNVGANNLPSGAIVDNATTCKTGTETIRLEANNASCDVVVTIPDPELFSTPNSPLLINLNSARLDLDLPYSYYDNGSLKRGSSGTKHVNFNRLWANVEHVLGGSQEDNSNYTVLVKSSARIINNSGARYPLTVKPFLKNSITGVVLKECAVNNDSETCINEISLPKSIFIPGSPLIVTFKTFATGMKDSDAILSSVDAKAMAGNHVYTEDDLIYALNHQQANSTITLESDIALRKPWEPIEKLSQIIFDGNGHKITGLKVNNKSDQQVGMFKFLVGPLTIKNLSLEGVVKSDVGNAGLIGGYLDGSNISILNSHFKSNVSAANMAGGLIGIMAGNSNANIKFESVTVDAIVTSTNTSGSGSAGGLISSVYSSTKFENIRINANIVGFNHLGGLAGFHGWRPIEVKNIIATAVIQTNQSAKSNIGGLLGHSNNQRLIGDRIDVFVNVTANNSTSVGGLVGQVDYFNSSLSNILVRGSIKTTTDPRERGNGIAGLALVKGGQVSIKNAIDKVTIIHGNKNYSSSLVTSESAVRFTADSANVFYALPAGVELLTLLPNTELVNPLSGTTADEEKTFLVSKGFDFNNTWTIKKDSANNDIIGIKEDSIPQFPKW